MNKVATLGGDEERARTMAKAKKVVDVVDDADGGGNPSEAELVLHWPLDKVIPTPENPRRFPSTPSAKLLELADSIRAFGVHTPVICRPHPTMEGCLELRAGERRLRASRLAGRATIPCIVRDMDDAKAFALTVSENFDRDDLMPLEEGLGFRAMLDKGMSLDEIATNLGKPKGLIARRAHLTTLHPNIQKALIEDEELASLATAAKLEVIARFGQEEQAELVELDEDGSIGSTWQLQDAVTDLSAEQMRAKLARRFRRLGSAPWPLEDGELVRAQGACVWCSRRSDAQPELFDDVPLEHSGEAHCTDEDCWDAKFDAWVERWFAGQQEKYPELRWLERPWMVQPCKKGDEAAIPVAVRSRMSIDYGSKTLEPLKVYWVKASSRLQDEDAGEDEGGDGADGGEDSASALEAKIATKNRIRREWIAGQMLNAIRESEKEPGAMEAILARWDESTLLYLARLFGANGIQADMCPFKCWVNSEGVDRGEVVKELALSAAVRACGDLQTRANCRTVTDEALEAFAEIFSFDLAGLRAAAAEAKPYPTGWGVEDEAAAVTEGAA